MKTAICDSRIPQGALSELKKYCDRIILLPPFDALQRPVASHPDMLLFPICEQRTILTHSGYADALLPLIKDCGYSLKVISEGAGADYPFDILLNAARVGNRLFCRLPYTSKDLLAEAEEMGIAAFDIKQGYAKCSTLVVDDGAIISADKGIAKKAESLNIEALLISPEGVFLEGYDRGFIGGATGNDGEHIFFCGDPLLHPDGKRIEDFCRAHGREPIALIKEPLYDIGTIFFI